jgi:branched-chain amino acid transport system substrate-binding protein
MLPRALVTNMQFNDRMRIGFSIAQTGALSVMGMQAVNGVRLWVSQVERKGGIRIGQQLLPVRLIIRDDGSRTSIAHKNFESLINEDHADVLLGPYSSHLTKAAAEICHAYRRILWNHGGASDEICRGDSHWLVSTLSPASQYLQKLPLWIATNDGAADHYLVLSSSKGTFASHVAAGLRQSIRALAKPVRLHAAELPESIDALIRLLNEMTPAVLILIGTFDQETGFIQTRRAWPKSIRQVACVSAGVDQFVGSVGELAEGIVGPSQWEPGVHHAISTGPQSHQFVSDFTYSFRESPNYVAAGAFATGLIIEECVRRAASLDDADLRNTARNLKTHTFYGQFRIDQSGRQIGHAMHLVRWQDGRKIVLT